MGRRGSPDGRLPRPARDVADPGQCHGLADRRGDGAARGAGRGRTQRVTAEPRNATITYPGGLRARWRWAGSGQAAEVFALAEIHHLGASRGEIDIPLLALAALNQLHFRFETHDVSLCVVI